MFLIRKTTKDNIGRTRPVVSKNTEIKKMKKRLQVARVYYATQRSLGNQGLICIIANAECKHINHTTF